MTREEAEKIAACFALADYGCEFCVAELCEAANKKQLGWLFFVDEKHHSTGEERTRVLVIEEDDY